MLFSYKGTFHRYAYGLFRNVPLFKHSNVPLSSPDLKGTLRTRKTVKRTFTARHVKRTFSGTGVGLETFVLRERPIRGGRSGGIKG